jgi:hypothetical protein
MIVVQILTQLLSNLGIFFSFFFSKNDESNVGENASSFSWNHYCPPNIDVTFKITIKSNSIVIHHKSNDTFKIYIKIKRIERKKKW